MIILLICLPLPRKKDFFFTATIMSLKPRCLCSVTMSAGPKWGRSQSWRATEVGGRCAGMERWFNINSSTMEAAQPSSSKVTKSQWGKVISKYQVYLQVFVLQKKKSLSYLLIVFPFPFGGTYCNEKKKWRKIVSYRVLCQHSWFYWEGRYLQFLERRTENESDQSEIKWSVTRVCCNKEPWLWTTLHHSLLFISKWRQAHRGWLPSTEPVPSWTSVLDCTEKWSMLASPVRHI